MTDTKLVLEFAGRLGKAKGKAQVIQFQLKNILDDEGLPKQAREALEEVLEQLEWIKAV